MQGSGVFQHEHLEYIGKIKPGYGFLTAAKIFAVVHYLGLDFLQQVIHHRVDCLAAAIFILINPFLQNSGEFVKLLSSANLLLCKLQTTYMLGFILFHAYSFRPVELLKM